MRPARADHAVSLLRRMATQGPTPNAMTYAATIDACAKATPSRPADALELLGHMEAANVKPDGVTYASAIHACARASPAWTDEALFLVEEMEAAGIPPEAFAYSAAIDVSVAWALALLYRHATALSTWARLDVVLLTQVFAAC